MTSEHGKNHNKAERFPDKMRRLGKHALILSAIVAGGVLAFS